MSYELVLRVSESPDLLEKVLSPELENVNSFRSEVSYSINTDFVVSIKSKDLNALRASINSHLLWLKTFSEVLNHGITSRSS